MDSFQILLKQQLVKAFECVPNSYLILSPELLILTASDLFLEATKSTRASITGKHIFDAFPDNPHLPGADGIKNVNASLLEVIRTKKTHVMDIQRYDIPDSTSPGKFIPRYWENSHTPVMDDGGQLSYIIQHANNVTDKILHIMELAESRKAELHALNKVEYLSHEIDTLRISELALEQSEKHFRHLADLVPAKISNALPSGEVTFFNKHWLNYSGLNFEDLRDFGYHNMMHPDEIPTFQLGLAKAAATGIPYESEMRFKDTHGEYRWHLNIASPVLNDQGIISMWVGSTTDIQRLKEEDQRKSDFIGMVSHELKTPLTSINAYMQVLHYKAQKSGDEQTAIALDRSLLQVKKMTSMINGFLSVSRLETAQILLEQTCFDFAELLAEVVLNAASSANTHTITCTEKLSLITISADQDKIEQVIQNLISNAVKYSSPGTAIHVDFSYNEQQVTVSISDHGHGINLNDQNNIFKRYFRVENELSKTISGFGIGLYFCAEIIRLHNGKIWVESTPGQGSKFSFSLPRLIEDVS